MWSGAICAKHGICVTYWAHYDHCTPKIFVLSLPEKHSKRPKGGMAVHDETGDTHMMTDF